VKEKNKAIIFTYIFLFFVSGSIIALDQWTKILVRSTLSVGQMWSPWAWLAPYARVVHWYNTGVAFGMFQNTNLLFAILAAIVAVVILVLLPRVAVNDWTLKIALSMQFAGAVGNLIDRVNLGHVTDFISVGTFPVFNVADSSITIGVCVLILGIWLQERRENKMKQIQEQQEQTAEDHTSHSETAC
jgi:signal peptidase II